METPAGGEVSGLLWALRQGDRQATDRLFSLVYSELRRMAHRQLGLRRQNQTLDTTALVHEAYLKLAGGTLASLEDRRHFFALVARAMRQIVVDHARRRATSKHGGGVSPVPLDEVAIKVGDRAAELVALDDALSDLARVDEELSGIVELRFFSGLTVEEIARLKGSSPRTVKRSWRKARAFLYAAMQERD